MKAPQSSKLDGTFYLHWAAHAIIMQNSDALVGETQLTGRATELMADWMAGGELAPVDAKDWTQVAQWLGVKNGGIATIAEELSTKLKPIVTNLLSGLEKANEPGVLPDVGGEDPVEPEIDPQDLYQYRLIRDQLRYLHRADPLRPSPTRPGTADEAKALMEFCLAARKFSDLIQDIGQDREPFEGAGLSLSERSAQVALARAEHQLCGLWDDEDLDMLIFEEARIEAMYYLAGADDEIQERYESVTEMLESGITALYQPSHTRQGRDLYFADVETVEAYFESMHEASFARYQKSQRQSNVGSGASVSDDLKMA